MKTRSHAGKMNAVKVLHHIRQRYLPILRSIIENQMLPQLNNPDRARGYIHRVNTQDQPISKNFESAGHTALIKCLSEVIDVNDIHDCYLGVKSDTSIETPWCIIQLDEKVCQLYDPDYTEKIINDKNGLKLHIGVAQTSLESTEVYDLIKKELVPTPRLKGEVSEVPGFYGIQKKEIDGKPVITLIAFLKWDYKDKWIATSIGLAEIPHSKENIVFLSRKSIDETRMFITDPSLYTVVPLLGDDELADLSNHSKEQRKKPAKKTQPLPAASGSPVQIPGSVQSDDTLDPPPVPDMPHL